MRLKSVLEDFEANTLRVVPGLLGRLFYVGRLHDGHGGYDHWGLAKVYAFGGPEEAAVGTAQRRAGVLLA
jgi:hypothetical protein